MHILCNLIRVSDEHSIGILGDGEDSGFQQGIATL